MDQSRDVVWVLSGGKEVIGAYCRLCGERGVQVKARDSYDVMEKVTLLHGRGGLGLERGEEVNQEPQMERALFWRM